ncbi:MAG: ComEC/Rec2 family competence protein [Acidimicrobiia bacterium]
MSVFVGVVSPWWLVLAVMAIVVVVVRRFVGIRAALVLAVLLAAGALSGLFADVRTTAEHRAGLPEGPVTLEMTVLRDPIGQWGGVAVIRPVSVDGQPWQGPKLAAVPLSDEIQAGDTVLATGQIAPGARRVRTEQVVGTVRISRIAVVTSSGNPLMTIGNHLRTRVRSAFGPGTAASGLATGLLIGDTSGVPAAEMEDLRRSGLSHFVAVSGSNVALFLLAWWFIGAPIAIRPRLRVAYGLVGLAVFAVATRWEPSVIRASVMAAVPLIGGLVGIPVDPWMALGVAVSVLLLVSAELASSVGFALSVLATAGVLVGVAAVRGKRPAWLWIPVAATIGAQAAVSPLLLAVFGSIPLASPVANLVATPVVTFTSFVATITAVVPIQPFVAISLAGSEVILRIARVAAGGPQLGLLAALGAGAVAVLIALRQVRMVGLAILLVIAVGTLGRPSPWPSQPTATVLDVGQGDAILIQEPSGSSMLVDGGRDPVVLDAALRRHGVRSVDLVVVTHGDTDHVGGLVELVAAGRAGLVWIGRSAHVEGQLVDLVEAASDVGTPVRPVGTGNLARFGEVLIEVLGPERRYKSDNDGSVVLLVRAGRSLLLPGDVEAVAQADLGPVRADVLVVPHHGSATTDLAWLEASVSGEAILSYGENRYGHPHPDVVALLDTLGVVTRHTAIDGDVVVPLGRSP